MLSLEEIERGAKISTRLIHNYHDREDAEQEYRIAAWRALSQADPERDPKPYQRASGRNAVRAFCKKRIRHQKRNGVSLDYTQTNADENATSLYSVIPSNREPNPAKEAAARDLGQAVKNMIAKLPPHMRRVMELQIEGLSTKEICKKLGFTRQAINRSKSRAKVLLRRKLEAKTKSKRIKINNSDEDAA